MADKKWHLVVGLLTYVVVVYYVIFRGVKLEDVPWLLSGFLVSMLGAWLPDVDQLGPVKKLLPHRHWLTHSAVFPIVVTVVVWIIIPPVALSYVSPFLVLFLSGHATHLWIDLLPGAKGGFRGSSLIHYAGETTGGGGCWTKNQSRIYLLVSGIVNFVIVVLILLVT